MMFYIWASGISFEETRIFSEKELFKDPEIKQGSFNTKPLKIIKEPSTYTNNFHFIFIEDYRTQITYSNFLVYGFKDIIECKYFIMMQKVIYIKNGGTKYKPICIEPSHEKFNRSAYGEYNKILKVLENYDLKYPYLKGKFNMSETEAKYQYPEEFLNG